VGLSMVLSRCPWTTGTKKPAFTLALMTFTALNEPLYGGGVNRISDVRTGIATIKTQPNISCPYSWPLTPVPSSLIINTIKHA